MHSVGEFDVFHLFCFPLVGFSVAMLMMIFDMDQRHTKLLENAGRSLADGILLHPLHPRIYS